MVPADLTSAGLHLVLQSAMGWDHSHPHEFRIGRQGYAEPRVNQGGFGIENLIDESTVRLHEVLGRVRAKAVYIYDFGDDWNHAVVVEKRLPADPNVTYPACIGGQLACPPEDCGGIPGFYQLLEAIQDPDHKFHEERLEWVGEEYDPEVFSIEAVNRALHGCGAST